EDQNQAINTVLANHKSSNEIQKAILGYLKLLIEDGLFFIKNFVFSYLPTKKPGRAFSIYLFIPWHLT
ncbi:MAG: hypothetical protein ACPLRA_02165, partial [Candidatus Saccharicenans sp.]